MSSLWLVRWSQIEYNICYICMYLCHCVKMLDIYSTHRIRRIHLWNNLIEMWMIFEIFCRSQTKTYVWFCIVLKTVIFCTKLINNWFITLTTPLIRSSLVELVRNFFNWFAISSTRFWIDTRNAKQNLRILSSLEDSLDLLLDASPAEVFN